MKKRLLSLLFATSLLITALTGCEKDTTDDIATAESETEEFSEEAATEFVYTIQTYGLDNALLHITTVDDSGETFVEETNSYGWFGAAGGTIAQMMEEWNIESFEVYCDEFEFLGWSAYTFDDPDAFEPTPLYDGKIFTTEEIMALELPASDVYFYTEWVMTCDRCSEQKICDVHYIDDDRHIICDDCYEDFATEMGLN